MSKAKTIPFLRDYPVKPIDELGDDKITQLSLLSTASNN